MKKWKLLCSNDGILVDYEEIIMSEDKPSNVECEKITLLHGCSHYCVCDIEEENRKNQEACERIKHQKEKRKSFPKLDDLCFANGWDLQEKIEWDYVLWKDTLSYLTGSGFGLSEMLYALIYLIQRFKNYTSWYVQLNEYSDFCKEYGEELDEIVNSTLEHIQEEAEAFRSDISGGRKNDWK